ncbi:MAG: CAP domain-containing protein [Cyanobacteria bacterium CRU_2_1]|nr:CAP domain-containing protein [Cyanobacteria bacterium RU_5_0]NJR58870.1 CAP domain-containing protein [Cyanobacteria bacterium CRU_2_1]
MRSTNHLTAANHLKTARAIPTQGRNVFTGQVGEPHPDRLYKLNFKQHSHLNLSLTRLKADANLTLLDRNGKTLSRSTHKGHSNESIARTVDTGTYYVRVSRHRGNTRYRLNLAVNPVAETLATEPPITPSSGSLIDQVLALTNTHRQQAGLKPLRLNANLSTAAQSHSQDMALSDYFDHVGKNGSTAYDRLTAAGYNYSLAAENIAVGFPTAASVVYAWMNNPHHRVNMMHPDLQEIGIGYYFLANDTGSTNYRYYWTQDFGTRA